MPRALDPGTRALRDQKRVDALVRDLDNATPSVPEIRRLVRRILQLAYQFEVIAAQHARPSPFGSSRVSRVDSRLLSELIDIVRAVDDETPIVAEGRNKVRRKDLQLGYLWDLLVKDLTEVLRNERVGSQTAEKRSDMRTARRVAVLEKWLGAESVSPEHRAAAERWEFRTKRDGGGPRSPSEGAERLVATVLGRSETAVRAAVRALKDTRAAQTIKTTTGTSFWRDLSGSGPMTTRDRFVAFIIGNILEWHIPSALLEIEELVAQGELDPLQGSIDFAEVIDAPVPRVMTFSPGNSHPVVQAIRAHSDWDELSAPYLGRARSRTWATPSPRLRRPARDLRDERSTESPLTEAATFASHRTETATSSKAPLRRRRPRRRR